MQNLKQELKQDDWGNGEDSDDNDLQEAEIMDEDFNPAQAQEFEFQKQSYAMLEN